MSDKNGFDPFTFLGIIPDQSFKKQLSSDLMDQILQYLIIKISELLPGEQISNIDSIDELFETAKNNIPEFNQKIRNFLDEFKIQYFRN